MACAGVDNLTDKKNKFNPLVFDFRIFLKSIPSPSHAILLSFLFHFVAVRKPTTVLRLARGLACDWRNLAHDGCGPYCTRCEERQFCNHSVKREERDICVHITLETSL